MFSLNADIKMVVAVAERFGLSVDPTKKREFARFARVVADAFGPSWPRWSGEVFCPDDISYEEVRAAGRLELVLRFLKTPGLHVLLHTYPLNESLGGCE